MPIAIAIREQSRNAAIITGLGALVMLTTILSLTIGAIPIPFGEAVIILLKQVGLFSGTEVDQTSEIVMTSIRLPRVVMTLLIGAALGISGAALQGLFRNPLVEPSLIGVSSGSAAAVVITIVFGSGLLTLLPTWTQSSLTGVVAFAGGSLATFCVLQLSMKSGRTNIATLVLIGVAVNALTGALIGLAIFYADEHQVSNFMFWTLGDLGGATWEKLGFAAPVLLITTCSLLFFGNSLNVLALGESEAFHIGVPVEQIKRNMILLSALAVGVSVSLAGIIGFIGLVVPHVIRTLFHADNNLVLPASALGGALLLVAADIISRVVVAPSELPIGVVTALVGAPFFMVLLLRANKKHEL